MENNEWVKYKIDIRERLKAFSLKILEISEKIPETTRGRVINYQITKSGTSVYANYRAALRARSKAEFYSKLCISVEEADETEMWIELLISSNILNTNQLNNIHEEILEILKILSSMRKKLNN
jgi:four helix bundle protein